MKRTIVAISIICLTFLINSCDTNEPPPPTDGEKPTLELTFEDASCTEAWLLLTTTNLQLPANLTLKKFNPSGDTISQILNLNTHCFTLTLFYQTKNTSIKHPASSIKYPATSLV